MLLEHSWWTREEDQQRGVSSIVYPDFIWFTLLFLRDFHNQVLSLPTVVAPIKVLIVPLSAKEDFQPLVQEVCEL